MQNAETQFSIYKINFEAVESVFSIHSPQNTDAYYDEIVNAIVKSIASIIRSKTGSEQQVFKHNGFNGIVFKTVHVPAWKSVAEHFMANNEKNSKEASEKFLTNTNVSYIFLYKDSKNIYACTGGYGSNYINKFIVKNFGLYLLPKMIKKDNQVLKNVALNNLLGNQISSNRVNRNSTSVSVEQDMSSIFRQLTVEANRSIAGSIGLEFGEDEPENKKINIINKDSIVIRRSISLAELTTVLNNISKLEKRDDAFVLNYMVLATKKGLKNSNLYEKMINDFSAKDFSRFILVGDDYEEYYSHASRYILNDYDGSTILIDKNDPISFDDVLSILPSKNGKITKASINTMLKWTITTQDNAGETVLYPLSIRDALQGFVEYGDSKIPCYLFNGNWFVFDTQYDKLLTEEYGEFFDNNALLADSIIKKWNLKSQESSEDKYNECLAKRTDIVVAHKAILGNIELADAILWDNDTIYFMHNKGMFDGVGARDLTNQILVAADYLQKNRASVDAKQFFENYYEKINIAAETHGRTLAIDKESFVNKILAAKNIVYIAGYLKGYKRDSNATYAKYLCIDLKKKLNSQGFGCCVVALS